VAAVQARDGHLVIVDAEQLSLADIYLTEDRVELPDVTGALTELSGGRGWLRRLAPQDWQADLIAGQHDAVVRSAWVSALLAVCVIADLQWLSPLGVLFAAEEKLVQQRACRTLGIDFPTTVVVTRPDRIPADLGDRLVVKPLGVGHYRDAAGVGRVVHATEIHRHDSALTLLAGAPFLVQQRIEARMHLRVVTVRGRHWVCELDAADLPLDWRADEGAHSSFRPGSYPAIGDRAVALAARLGVGYSSQDWIIDSAGNSTFLDLNPAGQWLFLPEQTACAVTGAIAGWLTGQG
jgi:hypothetical protein